MKNDIDKAQRMERQASLFIHELALKLQSENPLLTYAVASERALEKCPDIYAKLRNAQRLLAAVGQVPARRGK